MEGQVLTWWGVMGGFMVQLLVIYGMWRRVNRVTQENGKMFVMQGMGSAFGMGLFAVMAICSVLFGWSLWILAILASVAGVLVFLRMRSFRNTPEGQEQQKNKNDITATDWYQFAFYLFSQAAFLAAWNA